MPPSPSSLGTFLSRYTPKSLICLREGYARRRVVGDLLAGVNVAVIALPLAMAIGIASVPASIAADLPYAPPAMGLFTAVIAGLLISLMGGSRVQIGGPTGAFIVIVYSIASTHGYSGLATATLMAGVIIVLLGIFRLGSLVKFIPYPVVTGFTSGIAVIIAASQLKELMGLRLASIPADFIPKIQTIAAHAKQADPTTLAVGLCSLVTLGVIHKLMPRVPGAIIVVGLSAAVVAAFSLDTAHSGTVATIGSSFGSLPRSLPLPHLPDITLTHIIELIPAATTIALLASIESLLSAVVADGMTGYRHRSDTELIAQGVANCASACFWGLPATGAIARTVANIKAGGSTPLAGIFHAVTLLAFMFLLAPLASRIPLASLSAVLLMVAWNMSELDHFRTLLRAPKQDIFVLLSTFTLTVFVDLTVAVGVGMVLASLLFMKRMTDAADLGPIFDEPALGDERFNHEAAADAITTEDVPQGVEIYEINGPFFFGVADRLKDVLAQLEPAPRVFILRMRHVPFIDASAMHALDEFHRKCKRSHTTLILAGVNPRVRAHLDDLGLSVTIGTNHIAPNIRQALRIAEQILHHAPSESVASKLPPAAPGSRSIDAPF